MAAPRKRASAVPASALSTVLTGIALTVVGTSLDGLVRGLFQGAGVALVLVGVAVLSAHVRRPRDAEKDGMWLPSRDEGNR